MKHINVLVLDDDANILNLCAHLFKDQPFDVFTTSDHHIAMKMIEAEDIKVLLSDNNMPNISGVEFLRQVKEKKPDIIRILFTGHADVQIAEDAINKSAVYRLLNKPLDLKELLRIVEDAIEKFDLIRKNQELTEHVRKRNADLEALGVKLQTGYEAQRQFTSTVSHELRTPLASIKSSIDILNTEAPGKLSVDQKVFIKRVKTNIDRLARLINDVLDLSKLESGKMVMNFMPLCLSDQVKEIADMNTAVVQSRGLTLETELGKDLPMVLADKDRLTQVFSNLISNALKFTRKGSITFIVSASDNKNVMFSIRDTGIGIKEDDIPKLFEKFQQVGGASLQVGGTGLGLAICKEIIAAHGGRIWVESAFGKGSTFHFTIPVKRDRPVILDDECSDRKI